MGKKGGNDYQRQTLHKSRLDMNQRQDLSLKEGSQNFEGTRAAQRPKGGGKKNAKKENLTNNQKQQDKTQDTTKPQTPRNFANGNSLVMKLTPSSKSSPSMLFLGDFEGKDNYAILINAARFYRTQSQYPQFRSPTRDEVVLRADALMVPHHGGNT